MKFADLQFRIHPNNNATGYIKRAKYTFPNKYGVSVSKGTSAYCDEGTYEVAIMYDGRITYKTKLTDDVLRYRSEEDINSILDYLEKLPTDAVAK